MHNATLISDDLISLGFDSQQAAEALAAACRDDPLWLEVVTGRNTLTLQFDCLDISGDDALKRLSGTEADSARRPQDEPVLDVPVCYDARVAPDIERVCADLGIDTDELVRRHTGPEHRVRMLGFTPGFAYIDGLDEKLSVPRRSEPREHVAAGSVGIAGDQTGLYALEGPGGWQIVGRTPLVLFDAALDPPAVAMPGRRLRFVAVSFEDFKEQSRG